MRDLAAYTATRYERENAEKIAKLNQEWHD